jgi:hypothetical protein
MTVISYMYLFITGVLKYCAARKRTLFFSSYIHAVQQKGCNVTYISYNLTAVALHGGKTCKYQAGRLIFVKPHVCLSVCRRNGGGHRQLYASHTSTCSNALVEQEPQLGGSEQPTSRPLLL